MTERELRRAVRPGSVAPDVTLVAPDGKEVALASFWSLQPAVLVFVRHFG